jgi:acetyl esterase/lipase
VGDHDASNPLISPLFADFSGLPPTLIQTGSDEILLSDSERLAERAALAGWDCRLTIWQGLWHDFQLLGDLLPEADEAIAAMVNFVSAPR